MTFSQGSPPHLAFVFDEHPVLPSEDMTQYSALLQGLIAEIKPTGAIEAIWVRDILDLIWQAKRYRRWRKHILAKTNWNAARTLIPSVLQESNEDVATASAAKQCESQLSALNWLDGNPPVLHPPGQTREAYELTIASYPAQIFLETIPSIDRIERLIIVVDQRRDTLLREIERRRSKFAECARHALNQLIEPEPPKAITSRIKPTGR